MNAGFLTRVTAAIALIVLPANVARADEITVSGFTTGCFGLGCVPTTVNADMTAQLLGLTFQSSTFSGTTVGGILNLTSAPATPNLNNLGSFFLALELDDYTGQAFNLRVTVLMPGGINGPSQLVSSILTGSVSGTGTSGVNIDFNNTPLVFPFSFVTPQGATTSGSFSLAVQDLGLGVLDNLPVKGAVAGSAQTVGGGGGGGGGVAPEPATFTLFGTGLAGLAVAFRRRRALR